MSERFWLSKWARHDARMRAFELTKRAPSLYASTWEASAAALIRADIARALEIDEPEPLPPESFELELGGWKLHEDAIPFCDQCRAPHPEPFEGVNGWQCEACLRPFTEVFGCLACARVLCADCVPLRQSSALYAHTLAEIGLELGVCRERVLQIFQRAIYKLRKQHGRKLRDLYR